MADSSLELYFNVFSVAPFNKTVSEYAGKTFVTPCFAGR